MAADHTPLPERVHVSPDVVWQEIDGLVVLITLDGGEYFSFDDVGSRMWKLLLEEKSTRSVLDRLLAGYDVDEATLRMDLAQFLVKLDEFGALRVDGPAG